jgi:hypothetical protein
MQAAYLEIELFGGPGSSEVSITAGETILFKGRILHEWCLLKLPLPATICADALRIGITAQTFIPHELFATGDMRSLGVALRSATITPFPPSLTPSSSTSCAPV